MSAAVITGSRWDVIVDLLGRDNLSVLDVGCRSRELETRLPGVQYVGVDVVAPADVIATADEPLPFADRSFDAVVLADVLEHLNDPHQAIDEAMRIARKAIVVLLPNIYTLLLRARFALGIPMDKYTLTAENTLDRHRWLLNYTQAQQFTHARAQANNWMVADDGGHLFPFRRMSVRMIYRAATVVAGPDVWAWEYVARLEPALS